MARLTQEQAEEKKNTWFKTYKALPISLLVAIWNRDNPEIDYQCLLHGASKESRRTKKAIYEREMLFADYRL